MTEIEKGNFDRKTIMKEMNAQNQKMLINTKKIDMLLGQR